MGTSGSHRPLLVAALFSALAHAGCFRDGGSSTDSGARARDLSIVFTDDPDLIFVDDLVYVQPPDPCGESPPSPWCESWSWGMGPTGPLPLPGDPNLEVSPVPQGVRRDGDGAIVLDKAASGSYALVLAGCIDRGTGEPHDAQWWSVDWKADVPAGADLVVRARTTSTSDWQSPLWGSATPTPWHKQPKIDLVAELTPNKDPRDPTRLVNDQFLRVDVALTASPKGASPRLLSMEIAFMCHDSLGGLRQRDRRGAASRAPGTSGPRR